jgi:signal transduction histidine kinase
MLQVTMPPPVSDPLELAAALFQAAITAALAVLSAFLYHRYRKAWFAWWTVTWAIYLARIAAILVFLATTDRALLFAHQVLTGWTALALLWSALVFSRGLRLRPVWGLLALLLPAAWSYIAIYRLEHFLLAALPMVLFLSLASLWTGVVFLDYRRRVGGAGAAIVGVALLLWGLHHLDYPILRAQGTWVPWGYYLDITFELAVGAGFLIVVLDDLHRGVAALSALSGDIRHSGNDDDVMRLLLERPLTLPGVSGTALYLRDANRDCYAGGAGTAATWTGTPPEGIHAEAIGEAMAREAPYAIGDPASRRFVSALPIFQENAVRGALLLIGEVRDPFTALDEQFLLALGHQVGAALEHAALSRRLEARRRELERLSARMVNQHEAERLRLSRELHDETAQVFGAVKIELGLLRAQIPSTATPRLDRALGLVDTGIQSIRNVVNDLRPSLLDDLGLLPALRSLAGEMTRQRGITLSFDAPDELPPLDTAAELALYRALQEAMSNVLRHAGASAVDVAITRTESAVRLSVHDDGRGLPEGADPERFELEGHMGLAGMRERITALGGSVELRSGPGYGVALDVTVPI